MESLYIVMPAYNEEETIETAVQEWLTVVKEHNGGGKSRLLVLNDGSKDDTGRILDEIAFSEPLLAVVHKENSGHGPTVYEGYLRALSSGADYIFQTDSDGQTRPSEFEGFWRQRKRFDAVIGKRHGRKDGMARAAVSRCLSAALFLFFGKYISDANTPFRLMTRASLEDCIRYIDSNEPLTNVMLSAVYAKKGYRILFRPITFRVRQGGKNSVDIKKISKLGAEALLRFVKLNRRL